MNGLHLTADLRDCARATAALTDVDALRSLCLAAVHAAGLTPVGELFHRFPAAPAGGTVAGGGNAEVDLTAPTAGGATGVVLLAESHVAVHTWPELGAVTVDVYVCNFGADNSARAHTLMNHLQHHFAPGHVERHVLQRGSPASDHASPDPARVEVLR